MNLYVLSMTIFNNRVFISNECIKLTRVILTCMYIMLHISHYIMSLMVTTTDKLIHMFPNELLIDNQCHQLDQLLSIERVSNEDIDDKKNNGGVSIKLSNDGMQQCMRGLIIFQRMFKTMELATKSPDPI